MKIVSEIMDVAPGDVSTDSAALLWPEEPDEFFLNSVRTGGIIEPVLIAEDDSGGLKYVLAAGYKRLKTAEALGVSCPARLVRGNPVEQGVVYVKSNQSRIPQLDDGRLFHAFKWFSDQKGSDRAEQEAGELLGIVPGSKRFKLFLAWLDMPDSLSASMVAGRLPLAAVTILQRMNEDERRAASPYFKEWSWSRNNAVNFLTRVFEASRARGESVGDLLEAQRYASALNAGLSPRDGTSRLCETARRDRYPTVTRLREEFASAARELKGGTSWKIEQPDNFETSGVELTIRIKDAEGLEQAVKGLEQMAASSVWEKLWRAADES